MGAEHTPMTDAELAAIRGHVESWREIYDIQPREHMDIDRLLAEVDRLRAENVRQADKISWLQSNLDGEVLVEGSWFKIADLHKILGNHMRSASEHAREAKALAAKLDEARTDLAEMTEERDQSRRIASQAIDELERFNAEAKALRAENAELAAERERDALAAKLEEEVDPPALSEDGGSTDG